MMGQGNAFSHDAVPAEDRMQAFLWRHLVPTEELAVQVYDPTYTPPLKRTPAPRDPATEPAQRTGAAPMFNQRQVATRLRQLRGLFEEWLLTDEFYNLKVAECEASL